MTTSPHSTEPKGVGPGTALPRMLRALAMDCQLTDGWQGAAPDLTKAAEVIERLVEALEEARNVLGNSQAESGYCMCGDPVDSHTIGSGHAPVDAHSYMAGQVVEKIDAAFTLASGDALLNGGEGK